LARQLSEAERNPKGANSWIFQGLTGRRISVMLLCIHNSSFLNTVTLILDLIGGISSRILMGLL
jgi:hypothetical protein